MSEPTPIHTETVSLIHQNYNDLDIVALLRDKFGLGESYERELSIQVGRLRKEIKEVVALAPEAAEQAFREGHTWAEVCDILRRPRLLSACQITSITSRAQEKVSEGVANNE